MKRLFYVILLGSLYMNPLHAQDLVVQELRSPAELSPGNSFVSLARITNKGENYADYSYIGYYLSTDTILTFADRFLGYNGFRSLSPGESDSAGAYLSIPSDLALGNYYLFAFADYTGLVFESKENNNSKFLPVSVVNPVSDLTIPYFYLGANEISPGGYVSATTEMFNAGNSLSNWSYTYYYLSKDSIIGADDFTMGISYVNSISGGNGYWDYPSLYVPLEIETGTYFVIAKTDGNDNNIELSEDNNTAYARLQVISPKTDLENRALLLGSTSIAPGTYVYPMDSIRNVGTTFVDNVSISYYLSQDSILNIGDTFLNTEYLGYIYPGYSAVSTASLYLPASLPSGQYYLLSIVDESNFVREDNEDNNIKALKINVSEPIVDLAISSVYAPFKASPGNYINLQAYEFNQGNAAAGQHQVDYYLSTDTILEIGDTYLGAETVWGVSPQSYTYLYPSLYIPATVPFGNYYLLAAADNTFQVKESNEGNNVAHVALSVEPSSVDLSVVVSGIDSLAISAGTYLSPSLTETNSGTSNADYHYIAYYLSTDPVFDSTDVSLASNYVWGTPANTSYYYSFGFTIPSVSEGDYYLIAVTDYPSFVTESDESNNTYAVKIKVNGSKTDLAVSVYGLDSSAVNAGSYIYPGILESNLGSSDAQSHNIGYVLSADTLYDGGDINIGSEYVYGLSAGSSVYSQPSLYVPNNLASGDYFLLAIADYNGNVAESNEANNIGYRSITVQSSYADLSVYKLNAGASTVATGSYIYPALYDFNNGNQYADYHYVAYYLSKDSIFDSFDNQLSYDYVSGVSANSYNYLTPTVYIPSYFPTGNYYFIAVTDAFGYVTESNESNNYAAVPLTVISSGIDLVIGNLSSTDTDVEAGTFVYVHVAENNIGNLSASAHHIGFYLSKDSTLDDFDVYLDANYISGVNGGASFVWHPALLVPGSTPDGVYYVIAVADYGNGVTETVEYNNNKPLRITVGNPSVGPDVFVQSIYGIEGHLVPGELYQLSYLEVNNGTEWAGEHYNTFYLSTDSIHDPSDKLIGSAYASGGISPGGANFDSTLLVHFNAVPGKYFLIAWADASMYVNEYNEWNNTTVFPITIGDPVVTGLASDVRESAVSIYPNPSNGLVNFSTLKDVEKVEISDVNGHVVTNVDIASLKGTQVDLGDLGAGMYMVKTIKEGTVNGTHKLMIVK